MQTAADSAPPPQACLTTRERWMSLAEIALGSFIVIGHNVFHIVPNEVPILFVLGWISLRLRDGGWKAVGLKRPSSWWWTVLIALAAAAVLQLDSYVLDPVANWLWHRPADFSKFQPLVGNVKAVLIGLGVVWTFAAFGEEMGYRGYLLRRAADLGNRSKTAYWAALPLVSVLFGCGHTYKGPGGVLDSAVSGLILGSAYLLAGRNLWVAILAHGFSDTFALIVVFLGWADKVGK